jgi:glycogen(starch) synthase
MKVAFVSYEYPPETGGGGIGTYLYQFLPYINKYVELAVVVCGTQHSSSYWESEWVYRISCDDMCDFNEKLLPHFKELHDSIKFDIVEATDYLGWGLEIKNAYPELPFVVRLHTPLYLIDSLQFSALTGTAKLRFVAGSFLRLRWPKLPQPPHIQDYQRELAILNKADCVISPSLSIYNKLVEIDMLKAKAHQIISFGFNFDKSVLGIKARETITSGHQVVFIGRLEKRKGVLALADAIPEVLLKHPSTVFTFVGGAALSPQPNLDMIEYLKMKLKKYGGRVEFTGRVSSEIIPQYLEKGDIFVFPSEYESFGIACCEAMAASKAVLGSANGGMAEIIDDYESGLLTMGKKAEIVKQLLLLIENNELRLKLGKNARRKILETHHIESIIAQNIEAYRRTINLKLNS